MNNVTHYDHFMYTNVRSLTRFYIIYYIKITGDKERKLF